MTGEPIVSNWAVLKVPYCCYCVGACCIFQMGSLVACLAFGCFLFLITGHAILCLTDQTTVFTTISLSTHPCKSEQQEGWFYSRLIDCIQHWKLHASNLSFLSPPHIEFKPVDYCWCCRRVGCSSLTQLHPHGPWHAVWASALGGTVLGPGIIVGTILWVFFHQM